MVNLIVFPADTLCNDKVIMTPKRRRDAYIRKQQQKTTTTITITMIIIIIMITMIITMMMIMITMIKWHDDNDDNDNNYYYYDKVWCSFFFYTCFICDISVIDGGGFSEVTAINLINHFDIYIYLMTCIAHSLETNKTLPAIAHVSMIRWTEAMLLGSEPMFLGRTRLLGHAWSPPASWLITGQNGARPPSCNGGQYRLLYATEWAEA